MVYDCSLSSIDGTQTVDGDTQAADDCTLTSTGGTLTVGGDTQTIDGSTLTGHSQHRLGSAIASRTRQRLHQHDSVTTPRNG
jgi:hypothetical protein